MKPPSLPNHEANSSEPTSKATENVVEPVATCRWNVPFEVMPKPRVFSDLRLFAMTGPVVRCLSSIALKIPGNLKRILVVTHSLLLHRHLYVGRYRRDYSKCIPIVLESPMNDLTALQSKVIQGMAEPQG
jgi:hypothetical protein